jgi:hypothetical protein
MWSYYWKSRGIVAHHQLWGTMNTWMWWSVSLFLQGRSWTQLFILKCWSIWGMLLGEKSWKMEKWIFYHDIPCHTSLALQLFLVKNHILSLPNPQSYPDLTFCNVWLFLRLKIGLKSHFASVEESQQKVAAGVNIHLRRCLPHVLPAMAVLLLQVSVCRRAVHWWWLRYVTYVSSSLHFQDIFVGTARVLIMEDHGMLQFKMKGNVSTFSEWSVLHLKGDMVYFGHFISTCGYTCALLQYKYWNLPSWTPCQWNPNKILTCEH